MSTHKLDQRQYNTNHNTGLGIILGIVSPPKQVAVVFIYFSLQVWKTLGPNIFPHIVKGTFDVSGMGNSLRTLRSKHLSSTVFVFFCIKVLLLLCMCVLCVCIHVCVPYVFPKLQTLLNYLFLRLLLYHFSFLLFQTQYTPFLFFKLNVLIFLLFYTVSQEFSFFSLCSLLPYGLTLWLSNKIWGA